MIKYVNCNVCDQNLKAEEKLEIALDALKAISKQFGERLSITYPTDSTRAASEALEKIKGIENELP